MAHANFHIAVGMGLGVSLTFPFVAADFLKQRPAARSIGRLLIATYGLGLFAIVPGGLRHLGVPDPICDGAWTNIFVFHPLLNRITPRGLLVGELFIAFCFFGQYILILLALWRARRWSARGNGPPRGASGD